MRKSEFVGKTKNLFEALSESLFQSLLRDEELSLNLSAEDSLFLRFNGNRVRQNTEVEQRSLSLKLQAQGRTVEKSRPLTGSFESDLAALKLLLESCRVEINVLPPDPNQIPLENNGISSEEFLGNLLPAEALMQNVIDMAENSDLAGLYAGGPVIRANSNSKGQSHWFSSETFFLDYSLYDGHRAAKAVYSGAQWHSHEFATNLQRAREQLALQTRPVQIVRPGKYKTYLAPAAFSALLGLLSWGALSAAAWKQGRSPLRKFADRQKQLSPLLTIRENFGMGFTPRFNSLGEVAPSTISLIEKGELKELLVNSRTAKEFGLVSNAASEGESLRALECRPGTLQEKDVLKELGTGLYLSNLHYLNWSDPMSARITGMTRYACFWVEGGEIVGPIKDLRWDESLYEALGPNLLALTDKAEIDPAVETYSHRTIGGAKTPGALIDQFTFTL